MKRKRANNKTFVIIILMLVLSLFASLMAPRTLSASNPNLDEIGVASSQANYEVDDQKHEAPANHEPVFMTVFKFLVNCNPFKKETSF